MSETPPPKSVRPKSQAGPMVFGLVVLVISIVGMFVLIPHLHQPDLELKILAMILLVLLAVSGLAITVVTARKALKKP